MQCEQATSHYDTHFNLYNCMLQIFGFLQLVMFVSDVLLGFTALRKSSGTKSSKAFEVELKHSKSVLAAAKISARNSRRKVS